MKVNLLVLMAWLFSLNCPAQTVFQKIYGDTVNEEGFALCKSKHDNGFVVTGRWQKNINNIKCLIVKMNAIGDTVWTKILNNAGNSSGRSIIQTKDSGYVIVGSIDLAGNNNALVIKLNKSGQTMWCKTYDFFGEMDYGRSVIEAPDGNLFVIGNTSPGYTYPFLMKLDKSGNLKWSKVYQSIYTRNAESHTFTSDGKIAISGTTNDSVSTATNPLLFKVDTINGNFIWAKMHIGPLGSAFYSVINNTSNELVIGGGTQDYTNVLRSVIFTKFDQNGNMLDFKSYNECHSSVGYKLLQNSSGGYALTGFILPCSLTSLNSFIYLLNPGGQLLAHSLFGNTTSKMAGWDILEDTNNGFVITGSEENQANTTQKDDISLIKTNATGTAPCNVFSSTISVTSHTPQFFSTSFTHTTGITSATLQPVFTQKMKVTTHCLIVGTPDEDQAGSILQIWPNPSMDSFKVNMALNEISEVKILNINGQDIKHTITSSSDDLTILLDKESASGIYFLTVTKKDGKVLHAKLIKQN